ncbi:MAG: glycosyltransferase [Bdellovibrionales bacterium]|jgi:glycosyltransferase involved in cell wall biosynthesis|nr:glycosyltransferase [Bdellovibrionales bacterium]
MKILFESSAVLPVLKYGGTERIIYWLMKELVKKGHEVTLIGHPQSDVENIGVRLIPNVENLADWRSLIPPDIDLIHLFYTPAIKLDIPFIVTIEGNGQVGEVFHPNTVFISKKHMEIHGGEYFVYNGLDLAEYPFVKRKTGWRHFMFLAKASWKVKNLKDCIKAVKRNKKFLDIAGGKGFSFNGRIKYFGMVDDTKKKELFLRNDALLWPVRWHEPFGIAMIEAMAMGLPVIGSTYGSLPEVISAKTGILCKNYDDFEKAISHQENLFNPEEIREYVEEKFSSEVMASNYLKVYEKVLSEGLLCNTSPRYMPKQSPEFLQIF